MCSAQILRRDVDRHTGGDGQVDHRLVHALGVHVDLDLSAAAHDAFEDRLPELIAALRHAAFAVHAERDAADRGAGFQQSLQGRSAIRARGSRESDLRWCS